MVFLLAQSGSSSSLGPIFSIIGLVLLFMYLLPALIATLRKHPNITAIWVLNVLAGWTFVGWIVAIVWSFSNTSQNRQT